MGVAPYPAARPYVDPCNPDPPVRVSTPAATDFGVMRDVVDDKVPKQAAGLQPSRRGVVITNQGDGTGTGTGSAIFAGPVSQKGSLASMGVMIPVGAGRTFGTQAEIWVLSKTTGMPVGGNIFDVQNEYDA